MEANGRNMPQTTASTIAEFALGSKNSDDAVPTSTALLTFVRTTWFSDSVVAPFSLKTFFWFAKDSSLTSWKHFSTQSTNIMTSLDIQSSEVSLDNILFASLFIQGVAVDANEKNTNITK